MPKGKAILAKQTVFSGLFFKNWAVRYSTIKLTLSDLSKPERIPIFQNFSLTEN
jgi:hypothetical protein